VFSNFHWSLMSILGIVLVATLLVAFIARLVILWRDKRDAVKLIRQIAARVASDDDK
jgi:hypothetical protein